MFLQFFLLWSLFFSFLLNCTLNITASVCFFKTSGLESYFAGAQVPAQPLQVDLSVRYVYQKNKQCISVNLQQIWSYSGIEIMFIVKHNFLFFSIAYATTSLQISYLTHHIWFTSQWTWQCFKTVILKVFWIHILVVSPIFLMMYVNQVSRSCS